MEREKMLEALRKEIQKDGEYNIQLDRFLHSVTEHTSDSRIAREYRKLFPETSAEQDAYIAVKTAVDVLEGICRDETEAGEGSGDLFADMAEASCRLSVPEFPDYSTQKAEQKQIIRKNARLAYGWARFARDAKIMSVCTSALGYVPIV